MTRKIWIDLIGLLLIALLIVVGYKLSPLLQPQVDRSLPLAACDLQQTACDLDLGGGARLHLDVGKRPVPLVQPFAVRLQVEGMAAKSAVLDFTGVDMNMGINRFDLQPAGAGLFEGSASLPVCVSGQMLWQLQVVIHSDRERLAVPFRFVTGGPGHE
ncbi:MAG: hypothetical protein PHT48_03955 [Dechloromonas sp.]|nr:hypothetical protein [Dechloromonas sp.]